MKLNWRAIILLEFFCECNVWSLILREGERLRVFENRVSRRIIETKSEDVAGRVALRKRSQILGT
jgi:hypothetical protein